jgi:hypothetical protein
MIDVGYWLLVSGFKVPGYWVASYQLPVCFDQFFSLTLYVKSLVWGKACDKFLRRSPEYFGQVKVRAFDLLHSIKR